MTTTTAKPSKPIVFLPIEPGTPLTKCRWCPKLVYWSPHPSTGNPHPISVETHVQSYAPTKDSWGQGVTHWWDCAGAKEARADSAARRAAAVPDQQRQSSDLVTSLVASLKPEDS